MLHTSLRGALVALALAAPLATPATAQSPAQVQRLADELELMRIPTQIEIAVDRKDWTGARRFFADQVHIDFTSLVGGTPATIPADALIAGWSGNLRGNKDSLHIRGGALVALDGDRAVVTSNGYAWNRMPGGPDGDLWEVWGAYEHVLVRTPQGWRVSGFTFRMTHQRGSQWVRTTPGS